jgi:hypothetical protein
MLISAVGPEQGLGTLVERACLHCWFVQQVRRRLKASPTRQVPGR